MDLLFLGDPNCRRVELTGDKVAPLSRLAADYRVPPGFCLTTAAYTQWAPMLAADASGPGQASASLLARLTQAYAELAGIPDLAVAGRSSDAIVGCKRLSGPTTPFVFDDRNHRTLRITYRRYRSYTFNLHR